MKVRVDGRLKEYADIKRKPGVVVPLVQAHLLQLGDVDDRPSNVIHPSEMSKSDWCERATYFRLAGRVVPSERYNFVLQSIFSEGDFIHLKWQNWMRQTGKLWGDWKCRQCGFVITALVSDATPVCPCCGLYAFWEYMEVSLYHGMISGHEDGAVDDCLVELKSIGIGTMRADNPKLLNKFYVKAEDGRMMYDLDGIWKNLKRPFISHLKQAQIYLWLAQQMGLPFDRVAIVYEYKFNQQAKEFVVHLNMKVVQPLLDRAQAIEYALNTGTPPPCPYGGCKQCSALLEAAKDEGPTDKGRDVSTRRVSRRCTSPGGDAADSPPAESRPDTTGTRRHNRAERQCSDAVVPAAGSVAEVPGDAAGPGRGRRKVRRTATEKD